MHYLLCHTERDGQAGQSQAYQQHHQEEEVGAGGSERTCGWTAVVDQRHLQTGIRKQWKLLELLNIIHGIK